MKQLTVGSLFSGIGGIDLGLERAGMVTRWFSEIDPYASRVLAKHWPDVPNHGDITQIDFRQVEPVDVLCGGFPCQDLSNAGKRAGIDGERSGLWSDYARAIRDLRPRYVLVENVSAFLSGGNGDWFGRFLGDLAALGYDAEWHCIPAAAVGAPHRRDRIWVIAYAREVRFDAGRARESLQGVGLEGTPRVADAYRERRAQLPRPREPVGSQFRRAERRGETLERYRAGCGQWTSEPDVGRVAHGVPYRVDRIAALGNAVVPQIPELIGGWIVEHATRTAQQEAA